MAVKTYKLGHAVPHVTINPDRTTCTITTWVPSETGGKSTTLSVVMPVAVANALVTAIRAKLA